MAIGMATALLGSALIGGAGAAAAAKSGAKASNKSTQATTNAANQQLNYTKEVNAPYQHIGNQALNVLGGQFGFSPYGQSTQNAMVPTQQEWSYDANSGQWVASSNQIEKQSTGAQDVPRETTTPDYSAFQADPGYQFRLKEGQNAFNNSLIAQGKGLSGSQIKGSIAYNQGMASQEYGNWYNRLSNLAGIGQSATQSSINSANNASGVIGNANSANAINQGNISGNLANNIAGIAAGTVGNMGYMNAWKGDDSGSAYKNTFAI